MWYQQSSISKSLISNTKTEIISSILLLNRIPLANIPHMITVMRKVALVIYETLNILHTVAKQVISIISLSLLTTKIRREKLGM